MSARSEAALFGLRPRSDGNGLDRQTGARNPGTLSAANDGNLRVRVMFRQDNGQPPPVLTALGAIGRVVQVEAGFSRGWVSSPQNHSTAPDKAIEIATNQKAATVDPLKCAASPRPSAPIP